MKIILLTSKINFETAGGSVVDLHLKAKGLAELGHEVTVITTFTEKNIIKGEFPYKIKEETIPTRTLLSIQWHGYRILKKYEEVADVFYVDGQIFVYAAGLYRLLGDNIPTIAFFNVRLNCWGDTHGTISETKTPLLKSLKKKARRAIEQVIGVPVANHVDAFIFTTPMVEKLYVDWGFAKKKSVIIPDFVDMQATIRKHHLTPESIALKQKGWGILTIFSTGRMFPEKGFDLIIKAFELIKNKDRYRIILSGDGTERKNLERLVNNTGLEKYFTFTGWVDRPKLEQFLLESHIFIFPKWWIEYTSVLLIEVFAFGLPSIIPRGGGVSWLANDKALTFKEDDYRELAAQIEKLGNDESLRIKTGQYLFERVEALDAHILLEKLSQVLLSITKKEPPE